MISYRSSIFASALFAVNSSEETLQELQSLDFLYKDKETAEFFLSPLISASDKKTVLKDSLKDFSTYTFKFLQVLIDLKALHLLKEIEEAFKEMLLEKRSEVEAEVFLDKNLSLDKKEQLILFLKKYFKKSISLKEIVSKDKIHGVHIKTKDFIFNDSLEAHVNQFEKGELNVSN